MDGHGRAILRSDERMTEKELERLARLEGKVAVLMTLNILAVLMSGLAILVH